jgi:soluble lytic murein transglycosylase-like protein
VSGFHANKPAAAPVTLTVSLLAALIVSMAFVLLVLMPAGAADIRGMVDTAADHAGVPRGIAHAVIRQESNYNAALRGSHGEWGLGQIKCQTARGAGFSGSCQQLADPATNLRWSMRYLHQALARGGYGCAGFTLYNVGIFARPHCNGYGRAVAGRLGR